MYIKRQCIRFFPDLLSGISLKKIMCKTCLQNNWYPSLLMNVWSPPEFLLLLLLHELMYVPSHFLRSISILIKTFVLKLHLFIRMKIKSSYSVLKRPAIALGINTQPKKVYGDCALQTIYNK